MQEGYGCAVLKKPDFIADIVKQTKERVRDENFSVSIKIRIFEDLRYVINVIEVCKLDENLLPNLSFNFSNYC